MKCSTTKVSPANVNNSARKALVKSSRLRKSQKKAKEICQMYFMQLRSGLTIEKACYFREKTTKRSSPKTERSVSLSTYNDQSITFVFADGGYEIYVEELRKKQETDKVLFRYYDSQSPASETGDSVDGQKLMVSLSPTKDKDFLLHANNKEDSVELQKCENPLPDQTFFFLHTEPGPSTCVSFECKSNPGVFIGVKDNHLALIKLKDQTEHSRRENIKFKLS
ncbi:PREDICTED: interleukin-33 isoform X2 [Miniopterus natalensis]|uniref:interleukin-33 isoform X2 n=1 Tax=Miniopterus natalensis TaxID=291302 RepID=UPI0007A6EE10|nr:PREDICTED: interleukin-33 isoform X2 [Miniopterus natalensis]